MKYLLCMLAVCAFAVSAQPAKAPAPKAAPASTPNFCDVAYSALTETGDNDRVAFPVLEFSAVPWADVVDNHAKQLRIVSELSKQQDKGGDYIITVTETNTCDDGPTVRVASGSVYVMGVTLDGAVKVGDVMLQVGKEINDRYRARATQGAKVGWNHKNAKKVKRNELGQVVKD